MPLEADLNEYFKSKKQGVGCGSFARTPQGEVRFLVQHGQTCRREPSRKGAESTCTFFGRRKQTS